MSDKLLGNILLISTVLINCPADLASMPGPLACSHVVLPCNCCRERRRGGRREGRDILPLACNHIAYTEKEGEWPAAMLSYHGTATGKGEGEGGRGRDILPLACNHIAYTEKEGEGGGILPVCWVLWPAAMLSYHATAAGKEGEGEGGRGEISCH